MTTIHVSQNQQIAFSSSPAADASSAAAVGGALGQSPESGRGTGLRRNAAWVFGGQLISLLVQAVYFAVLARLLGLRGYGLVAGVAATVALASQYSSLGSGFIFLRYVSADPSRFKLYLGNTLLSLAMGGSLVVLTVTVLSQWLLPSAGLVTVVCLAVGECLFAQTALGASRVFQALEQLRFTALITLSVNTLRMLLALTLLLSFRHTSAQQWAVASMIVSGVGCGGSLAVVFRRFGLPTFSARLLRKHFREGLLFAASGSSTSIFNDIDKVLLAHAGEVAATGLYAMGYRAIEIATMPLRSIHTAAYPRFCKAGNTGIDAAKHLALQILRRTLPLAAAAACGLALLAPLLPMLVGRGFEQSVQVVRLLCLIPVLRSFHLSAGDALAGSGLQRYRLSYETAAAAFNIVLNLALIPRYSWYGAAWASLATDGSLAIASWATLQWACSRRSLPLQTTIVETCSRARTHVESPAMQDVAFPSGKAALHPNPLSTAIRERL